MFEDISSEFISKEAQNAPNFAFAANPVLGNVQFSIMAPPTKGKVQPGFPTIPYISLESLLFFQGMSNPFSSPTLTLGGSNTGQNVISGQVTMQDSTGTSRYQQGFQNPNG